MDVEEIKKCRICGNDNLTDILDLGVHALSGRFPKKDEENPPQAPLILTKCGSKEGSCGLLQLKHTVSLDEMYGEHYGYRSGLNNAMIKHLKEDIVGEVENTIQLNKGDIVLDIGSNDATLLKSYANKGLRKIGVDPAGEKFRQHYSEDINLRGDFFNKDILSSIFPGEKAKVVTSIAMLYDLPDPVKFASEVRDVLDENGIWVSEQSYMPHMLEQNAFDTICHEHLEYYALKQIKWILEEVGMRIIDVVFNKINGASFRFMACHKDSPHKSNLEKINSILEEENEKDLENLDPYKDFQERVESIRKDLVDFLKSEKEKGKSIYIYGASTKGNTLLQYFGIGKDIITAAAEKNPDKFGHVTPKTRIPIISEEEARAQNPDYFLVLPWHFKENFLERERGFLEKGGKFIFPLPKFDVVGEEETNRGAKKKALITGITGQIGSYLAELLADKGYDVYGIVRRTSLVNARERVDHIKRVKLIYGDLSDYSSIEKAIREVKPDEIYNLAAQSHVWVSFLMPEYTTNIDATGVLRICEAARQIDKKVKIYQASTSELFGGIHNYAVNEKTNFHPKSPYGVSKLYAYWIIRNYREAYNMFCSNGIVFNTESPRRGENFVTRKITKGVADIVKGKIDKISLGNLNAKRDWSHARDVAEAIWKILQADKPGDYVIASGKAHSIREFVEEAFRYVGIEIKWKGVGSNEVGYNAKTGKELITVDPKYFRPAEVDVLIGDSSRARNELEWSPKHTYKDIVKEMMDSDLARQ